MAETREFSSEVECPICEGEGERPTFDEDGLHVGKEDCPACNGTGTVKPDDHHCPVCGADMEWVECWDCGGEGGFHDCGEDCCCCLDKEEITVDCDICDGEGGYMQCTALPHGGDSEEADR